jgi:predicted nucleic acid-binding protein
MSSVLHAFIDTNILVYWIQDQDRAKVVKSLLAANCVISVQVLNEFANVLRKKLGMSWEEVRSIHVVLHKVSTVVDLTRRMQALAMYLAERYKLTIYDANILGAAALSGCALVYSEDMQDGLRIQIPPEFGGGAVAIKNPFLEALV